MKKIIIALLFIFISNSCYATKHLEGSYQAYWCKAHNGIMEYKNSDKTRVDCLTETHVVEFDFAKKWAESVGQALYYQFMTNKKPMVVLIIENEESEQRYVERVKSLSELYNFDFDIIKPSDIIEKNGTCTNPKCKCHKNQKK